MTIDQLAAEAADELFRQKLLCNGNYSVDQQVIAIIKAAIEKAKDEWNDEHYVKNNNPSYRAPQASEEYTPEEEKYRALAAERWNQLHAVPFRRGRPFKSEE